MSYNAVHGRESAELTDEAKQRKALKFVVDRVFATSLNSNLSVPQRLRQIEAMIEIWADARVKGAIEEFIKLLPDD